MSVKLDPITRLKREEKFGTFNQDTLKAWKEYQTSGLHVTSGDADAWLVQLADGNDIDPPECHD